MSAWDLIHTTLDPICTQKLYANYVQPFPVEVRNHLRYWIEDKFSNSNFRLDPENQAHHNPIVGIIYELYYQIEGATQNLQAQNDNGGTKSCDAMYESLKMLKSIMYSVPEAVSVYRLIHHCLDAELKLLQEERNPVQVPVTEPILIPVDNTQPLPNCREFSDKVQDSSQRLSQLLQQFDEHVNAQDSFIIMTENMHTLDLQAIDLPQLPNKMEDGQESDLYNSITEFINEMRKIYNALSDAKNEIFEELEEWRKSPTSSRITLVHIQAWFSNLVDIISNCQTQLSKLVLKNVNNFEAQDLFNLQTQFFNLFKELIDKSLVIEVQPRQILKKGTNFNATLRFLAGSSDHVKINCISASMLSRFEMNQLIKFRAGSERIQFAASSHAIVVPKKQNKAATSRNKFREVVKKVIPSSEFIKLVNCKNSEIEPLVQNEDLLKIKLPCNLVSDVAGFDADNGGSTEFPKIQIKKVGREKENAKSVLHIEYWVLFHAEVSQKINGRISKWWVSTVSHSVRILTNIVQESGAWESAMWSNALNAETMFYANPTQQPLLWPQLADALNKKFVEMTGVGLNNDHLEYLHEKAKSIKPIGCSSTAPNGQMTFSQFCEEPLPGKTFTFWRWLYEIAKLISKYLGVPPGDKKGPWQDGLIAGFISREATIEKLTKNNTPGAFLLRFSDSGLGGICLAWLHSDHKVYFQEPSQKADLLKLPLSARILAFPSAQYLFPGNFPKEDKFKLEPEPSLAQDQSTPKPTDYVGVLLTIISKLSLGKSDSKAKLPVKAKSSQAPSAQEASAACSFQLDTVARPFTLPAIPQQVPEEKSIQTSHDLPPFQQVQQASPSCPSFELQFQPNQVSSPFSLVPTSPQMQINYEINFEKVGRCCSGNSSEGSTMPLEESLSLSPDFDATCYDNINELTPSFNGDCNHIEMMEDIDITEICGPIFN